jgi:hypothetical protein
VGRQLSPLQSKCGVYVETYEVSAAYLVEVIAPTRSAMVSKLGVASNICHSLRGTDPRTEKPRTLATKATLKQFPFCAQLLERPTEERLQARPRIRRYRLQCLSRTGFCLCHSESHLPLHEWRSL